MKRILSLALVLILLFCAALPLQAAAKKEVLSDLSEMLVQVPNNKAKSLEIRWLDPSNRPDGYQVFRSSSGKKGTYQKIATVKKKVFTDTGLKNQTLYYYAVRAFANKNGKVIYSPFLKDCGMTKLTKTYVRKLLMKAYQVRDNWLYICNEKNYNPNQSFTVKKKVTDADGSSYVSSLTYCLVTNKTITSKAKLKAYLRKYFVSYQVDDFVDRFYTEKKGKLYVRYPEWGDGAGQIRSKDQICEVVQSRSSVTFSVLETWQDYMGTFLELNCHSMTLDGNRMVFCDDDWIPSDQ